MIWVTTTGGSVLFSSFIKVNYTQALFLLWSMNYWILCSLSVLERYYGADKHRFGLGCRCKVFAAKVTVFYQHFRWLWRNLCACAFFLTFLGYLWFWIGNIKVARWNGLEILIPKHMWKSKIGLLEQIWAQNPFVTFPYFNF